MDLEQAKVVSKMVRGLVNHLAKRGIAREHLLEQLDIKDLQLNDPDYFFPLSLYNQLYSLGQSLSNDAYLGFSFGEEMDLDVGSDFGLMASTCESLADALRYQLRYSSLVRNFDRFDLIAEGENLIVRWHSDCPVNDHLVEEVFARRTNFIRKFVLSPEGAVLKGLNFQHDLKGRDIKRIEEYCGCPVAFNQPFNQAVCHKAHLSLPMLTPDRNLREFYESRARKKIGAQGQVSIVDQVSRLLTNALPNVLSLEKISDDLSISPRTLQRQLQQNGYTLKELYTEVKRKIALDSLRAGHSLMAISLKLGFSEQSAFQRAFKRWQGCTPKEFQQLYLSNNENKS